MLRPLRVCDRQKRKRLRNRCFATATDINGCSVARSIEGTMVSTARSIEITKVRQFKSRVLMYSYATRGLGFLVRCATISRQLGQRSGGSPLFMINHRSSLHTTQPRPQNWPPGCIHLFQAAVPPCCNRPVVGMPDCGCTASHPSPPQ